NLETRFTAGLIQNVGATPTPERFFGGNQVHPFVADSSWIIQSDAYIRSLRENQLGASLPAAGLGGSRFYSANSTLAWTLWGRPIFPKELAEPPAKGDIGILNALNGAYSTVFENLSTTYQAADPKIKDLGPPAKKIGEAFASLAGQVRAI